MPAARRPRASRVLLCVVVCSLLGASGAGRAATPAATRLLWPLAIPGTLLSTFGEYRYDHLHAGIDISTGGATGIKVRAAAAGVVYRVKVEWRGYGRAVYLRHADGLITVYAHLERFEDARLGLERRVARRAAEAGTRYPGDIYFDPPLPVARGQIIAYSGESGVGLPHLHFEVRRGEEQPIDPFAGGLPHPPDDRAPILEQLVVEAAGAATFVDGSRRERAYRFVRRAGAEVLEEPVRVSGPFHLGLAAYDPKGVEGRAGVASLRLRIDGALRYRLDFRNFRFEQYPQAGLLYDHRGSGLSPARFTYRLHRLEGNELASVPALQPGAPAPAWFDLEEGGHRIEVEARDFAGRRRVASGCVFVASPGAPAEAAWDAPAGAPPVLRFRIDPPAAPAAKPRLAPGCVAPPTVVEAGAWSEDDARFVPMFCSGSAGTCGFRPGVSPAPAPVPARIRLVRLGVPGPWRIIPAGASPTPGRLEGLTADVRSGFLDVTLPAAGPVAAPVLAGALPGAPEIAVLDYRDELLYGAGLDLPDAVRFAPLAVRPRPGAAEMRPIDLDLRLLRRGEAMREAGPGFTLEVPPGGPFHASPLGVRIEPIAGEEGLPAIADAVELLPAGGALRDRAVLAFDVDPQAIDPLTLGVYRWDDRRARWLYEGGDFEPAASTMTLKFRRYGRFALLQDASPPSIGAIQPAPGATLPPGRPRVAAQAEDTGEGLDFDSVTFTLDGVALEAEFDPDRGVARALKPPSLRPGPHRLEVGARDRAGNRADPVVVEFTVR